MNQRYQLLEHRIKEFNHPLVNTAQTRCDENEFDQLEVALYDHKGQPIVHDEILPPFYITGIRLEKTGGALHIDHFYLEPAYHRKRIGSSFIEMLASASAQDGLNKMSLFIDPKTDSTSFWLKRGFIVVPRHHSQVYLERTLF